MKSNINKEIIAIKKRLIEEAKKIGLYENFGQKEVRILEDKYSYCYEVKEFDLWAMNFTQFNK